jgi:excisionase family DNA binding protein
VASNGLVDDISAQSHVLRGYGGPAAVIDFWAVVAGGGFGGSGLGGVFASLTSAGCGQESTIRVAGEHGGEDPLILPREDVSLLAFILAQAAEGRGVTVIPSHAELTTQQAADMLNVSRPYLIKLLETGEIPFRLIGKHRRITCEDLQDFKRRDDAKRRTAADQLAALGQELGS